MSPNSLLLFLGFCLFPLTIANCIQSTLSLIGECSGNGECVSDKCVCNEGFNGMSIFYNAIDHDCSTHKLSFNIITYISFGTCCLALISAVYRLVTYAPHKRASWIAARDPLTILCGIVASTAVGLVWQGLYIFSEYYVHNSIVSCILFIIMWCILQLTLFILLRSYINLAWTTALQKNLQKSHLIVIATPLVANVLGAGSLIGIFMSPDHEMQIAFAQSFGGVFGPCLMFLALSLIIIVTLILKSIRRHLEVSQVSKHTKNYEIIQHGIAKLHQVRLVTLISLVVPATATVAWVVMPPLISYLLPLFFTITALCDILFVLRVLTPPQANEGRSTAGGMSQSRSGVLDGNDR